MKTTLTEATLTEALLARGFSHRQVGDGAFHDIVRISDGVVVSTRKAHEAWDFVRAFDRRTTKKRLTREQSAKVRSLVEDEGETRAAAEAWVRAFEPGDVDAVLDVCLGAELAAVAS